MINWEETPATYSKPSEHRAEVGPFSFRIIRLSPGVKTSKSRLVISLQAGILKQKQKPVVIFSQEYSKCGAAKRAAESIIENILLETGNGYWGAKNETI